MGTVFDQWLFQGEEGAGMGAIVPVVAERCVWADWGGAGCGEEEVQEFAWVVRDCRTSGVGEVGAIETCILALLAWVSP